MGIETALASVLGGLALGGSVFQGNKAFEAQKAANEQARKAAEATAKAATEASNKANQKRPDVSGLLAANQAAGGSGQGGTMLTGPNGIDPSLLKLGKTTLLGGGG